MAKTGKQVQGDLYRFLKDSGLYSEISGGVYREGCRPRNSDKEDAVVVFTAGLAGQVQTGVVTINIYVPGVDPYDNGVFVEDGRRCEELEVLAQAWVDDMIESVNTYEFELDGSITTLWEAEINQSFIVIKLSYRLFEE